MALKPLKQALWFLHSSMQCNLDAKGSYCLAARHFSLISVKQFADAEKGVALFRAVAYSEILINNVLLLENNVKNF